ncbi:protein of unknown function [Actinopolymorpha cephalotaxi]|uniref:DUF4349 domain-containing protein n=1 Tax=Actinopolymorpha cephalotaxi TaxID=504797 RepID=A0A1I2PVC5_9ACTN|nr:DUF4349 domain-containing protein [Actinopolymorpha cephalotaxi]NYH83544.1 hypothetical protein [Actinopolymorpha cephalotaxi]SFG17351.1 protein of unknown function [Actinopolymorpha cephalotaxi]
MTGPETRRQFRSTLPSSRTLSSRSSRSSWFARTWGLLPAFAVTLALAGCAGTPSESAAGGGSASKADPGAGQPVDRAAAKPGTDAGAKAGGSKAQPASVELKELQRSIVRTATLGIRTKDARAAARRAASLAEGSGGYVASQESSSDKDGSGSDTPGTRGAGDVAPIGVNLVLRVPVADFDRVVGALRELGTVRTDSQQATDVTDQVVDVDSRVKSQQRSIDRLRTLLGQAKTVGEVMQVETELASREAELESLQARAAALGGQATLATIRVDFETPPVAGTDDGDHAGTGFLGGLRSGWSAFAATGKALLTALGAMTPFLVLLGLCVLVGLPLRRRLRARSERRDAPVEPTPPPAAS